MTIPLEQEYWKLDTFMGYGYIKHEGRMYIRLPHKNVSFGEQDYHHDTFLLRKVMDKIESHLSIKVQDYPVIMDMKEPTRPPSVEESHWVNYRKCLKIVRLYT